mgnify:CR=1 FL=1
MKGNSRFLFLSLHQPVTKKQIWNTKCQPKCFGFFAVWKEKRQPSLFSFQNCANNKRLWLGIKFYCCKTRSKKSAFQKRPNTKCCNYLSQWWVEFEIELTSLFTNTFRGFLSYLQKLTKSFSKFLLFTFS